MFIMYNHHAYFMFPSSVRSRVCWSSGSGVLWPFLVSATWFLTTINCIWTPEKYRKVNPTEIVLRYTFTYLFGDCEKMPLCWVSVVHPLNTRDDLCIFARFSRILMSAASKVVVRTGSPLRNPLQCRARSWEANAQDFDNVQNVRRHWDCQPMSRKSFEVLHEACQTSRIVTWLKWCYELIIRCDMTPLV